MALINSGPADDRAASPFPLRAHPADRQAWLAPEDFHGWAAQALRPWPQAALKPWAEAGARLHAGPPWPEFRPWPAPQAWAQAAQAKQEPIPPTQPLGPERTAASAHRLSRALRRVQSQTASDLRPERPATAAPAPKARTTEPLEPSREALVGKWQDRQRRPAADGAEPQAQIPADAAAGGLCGAVTAAEARVGRRPRLRMAREPPRQVGRAQQGVRWAGGPAAALAGLAQPPRLARAHAQEPEAAREWKEQMREPAQEERQALEQLRPQGLRRSRRPLRQETGDVLRYAFHRRARWRIRRPHHWGRQS